MKADATKETSVPVMALTKAMKQDGLEEPSTGIMAVQTGDQSGRDGEAPKPRHGIAQELSTPVKTLKKPKKKPKHMDSTPFTASRKAVKADVKVDVKPVMVLSTGKGRSCKTVRALDAETQAMLDDTKNRQTANAVDASGGAPVAEAQAMLEDTQTRELAVAEASVTMQRAMESQDNQTTRSALVAADVAGADSQLLSEARERPEHLRLLRARFNAGAFRLGSNAQLKCGNEAISAATPDIGVNQETGVS